MPAAAGLSFWLDRASVVTASDDRWKGQAMEQHLLSERVYRVLRRISIIATLAGVVGLSACLAIAAILALARVS